MSVLPIVRVVAILASGIMAGILLGDRMGGAFARSSLSASSFVQLQQIIHIHFVKILPVLAITATAAGLGWLILVRVQWKSVEFWVVAAAATAIVLAFVLTLVVNFPINEQLMTWSVAAPPSNMREIWSPWEKAHTVRTVLWVGAFALEVVALGLFASRDQ